MNLICPVCNSILKSTLSDKLARKNDFVCNHCKSKIVFKRPRSEVTYLVITIFLVGVIIFSWLTPEVKFMLLTILIIAMYLYDYSRIKVQLATSVNNLESNRGLIVWILASILLLSGVVLYLTGNNFYMIAFVAGFLLGIIGFLNLNSTYSRNKFLSSTYILLCLILMCILFLGLKFKNQIMTNTSYFFQCSIG